MVTRSFFNGGRIFCLGALATLAGPVAQAAYQPNVARAVMGSTAAEVHARFPAVIYHNFTLPGASTHLARLTDKEWQGLYYAYGRAGGSAVTLDAMVARYAPASYAHVHYVSRQKGPFVPPSTGIDNTLYEIYLDFRTAPFGSATAASALLETAVFAGGLLYGSYQFGQTVGGGMAWLISTYDPPLWAAIGYNTSGLVNMMNAVGGAANSFAQGFWEWHIDEAYFSVPLWDFGSFSAVLGDLGLLDSIQPADVAGFCVNPGDC
jgi:hypothetical protein